MFVAAWSFDMQYGTRDEAIGVLKELRATMPKVGWKAKKTRVLHGSIGVPESRITVEHDFASLADLESSWDAMHKQSDLFRKMIGQMKAFVVSGTPRWEIYRVIDEG